MKSYINDIKEMRSYLLLWFTQLVSGLGSAMTAYALVIWSYTQTGSALGTAALMVCSYAPYVVCSIFAGALSDRWDKKKTMLVCDALAALSTLIVLLLLKNGVLRIWHLYIVNAVSGLMNTFQQPASEVATTALLKREYYQKVGGLRYLSNSLNSILTPILTTAIMGLWGIGTVIAIDLCSFAVAFVVLLLFIPIPKTQPKAVKESILQSAAEGVSWLKANPGIFHLMLSMCTENFFLALGNSTWVWCFGGVLGWITLPWMSANLEALNRLHIPMEIQGRVFAARNSFQFFTIPLGYFLGGMLVDQVFEPIMAMQTEGLLVRLFGSGKGSGAAFLFAVLWLAGIAVCMIFRADQHIWKLEE